MVLPTHQGLHDTFLLFRFLEQYKLELLILIVAFGQRFDFGLQFLKVLQNERLSPVVSVGGLDACVILRINFFDELLVFFTQNLLNRTFFHGLVHLYLALQLLQYHVDLRCVRLARSQTFNLVICLHELVQKVTVSRVVKEKFLLLLYGFICGLFQGFYGVFLYVDVSIEKGIEVRSESRLKFGLHLLVQEKLKHFPCFARVFARDNVSV